MFYDCFNFDKFLLFNFNICYFINYLSFSRHFLHCSNLCDIFPYEFLIIIYKVAMKRVRTLLDLDFEQEATKSSQNSAANSSSQTTHELMWAVFEAVNK